MSPNAGRPSHVLARARPAIHYTAGTTTPWAGGEPQVCELRKMYLRPEARGRGLGRAMLARCLDLARQLGYRPMYL
ncbi:MAG: GNAT family N-acetyltransferase [Vicinamibacteria bacterium]|nr:GNAT family N-acetyltransferase [Vicinamibacteria bacterium]